MVWRTLEIAVDGALRSDEQRVLLEIFALIPELEVLSDLDGVKVFARALRNARQPEALLRLTDRAFGHQQQPLGAELDAYRAWAFTSLGRHAEALGLIDACLGALEGATLGFAFRVRGVALGALGGEGWHEAFRASKELLTGRSLGLCLLEEGGQWELTGDGRTARSRWSQALGLVNNDPYYSAWLRMNLGVSALRDDLPEAEVHFLEMECLTRSRDASRLRPRALCGLGTARRAMGEWQRALTSYRRATETATEPDDVQQAWRGLGHTLRLAGSPGLALEPLQRAIRAVPAEAETGVSWVYVDLAAAHAKLDDPDGARLALGRTGTLLGEDADRAAIVRAELAFGRGDANEALRELRTVRLESLWAREERNGFEKLFQLATVMGLGEPRPLPRPPRTVVEVRALGVLSVRVNGRVVPLKPTSRAGEVLVLLLERGGEETTERLLDALYPAMDTKGRTSKRQSLWVFVRQVRDALGWGASVAALGGAYRLDPNAEWRYDAGAARTGRQAALRFLEGVYSAWVGEVAEELAGIELRDLN